jgi:hypothetical protein
MSSVSAIPDSNPTRAQLRLVVLGQWVRAGLELARGAASERGLFGGVVALWRVLQAVRLAILLAQRLSELNGALARAARATAPGETAPDFEAPPTAAFLQDALIEITRSIRDALGLAPDQRRRPVAGEAASAAAEPEVPRALGRPNPPPDRPPRPERSPARVRSPCAPYALDTALPPIAALAIGRLPLARSAS